MHTPVQPTNTTWTEDGGEGGSPGKTVVILAEKGATDNDQVKT